MPPLLPGVFQLEDSSGVIVDVLHERELTPAADVNLNENYIYMDPPPHFLIPENGPKSAGMSLWRNLGFPNYGKGVDNPPQFSSVAGMIAGTGELDTTFPGTVIASGNAGSVVSPSTVNLDSPSLSKAIGSNPGFLIGTLFDAKGEGIFTIQNATLEGNQVILDLVLAQGAPSLQSIGQWEVREVFFTSLVNGLEQAYPPDTKVSLLFEGADPDGPGSLNPRPNSIVGPTTQMEKVMGKTLFRYRVIFEYENLAPSGPYNVSKIGLRQLRFPFSF